ncbi:hypothetical protein ABEB36_000463 [Hypothenemus hampei]|uniref:guanylate kinase n=1 Tax=Hypothenemus hampei TaxID=57062 RepID=A0ABD1FC04_HYPHA
MNRQLCRIERILLVIQFRTFKMQTPRPLVFCGPSGSGKSTLVKRLMTNFPDRFGFTVSHTTRAPRPGEINGQHYYFTDKETMRKALENGEFIEHAVFSGNTYGTSYKTIEDVTKQGKIVLMDIDMEGVKQVKNTALKPWCVFVQPPSMDELRTRLVERQTESPESLEKRMAKAHEEISFGLEPNNFDKIIVNDNLLRAYEELEKFVIENVLTHDN